MKKTLSASLTFASTMVLTVSALVASALLLVDYVRPSPVFCSEGGCGAVKQTAIAHPFLNIPLPAFGLAGLFAIALLACIPGRGARIVQAMLAMFGAIVAAGLIVVQIAMHQFCPYCMVVDTASILLAGLSVMRARAELDPPANRVAVFGSAFVALAAIGGTLGLGFTRKPLPVNIPASLLAEYKKTPNGKITVIDFVDFECPFCRMTHTELGPMVSRYKDQVQLTRKHVPLRMHPHAMDAARAACCAEDMGKGEAVAEALFKTEDLSPEGCEKVAVAEGLELEKFRTCVKDPATEARIKADIETFRAAKGHGLPTIYVGNQRLEGAQDQASLQAAFDVALKAL